MEAGPMHVYNYTPPPDHPLHSCIDSIWRADHLHSTALETILPMQNVDILFNLGAPLRAVGGKHLGRRKLDSFHVVGPHTTAFTSQPDGRLFLLGVSFKMESCSAWLPLPVEEITDATVDGTDIFPRQQFLYEQVGNARSFDEQCKLLMRWLSSVFQPSPHFELIQRACWALRDEPTSSKLDRIAAKFHLSSRHLRRIMLHHVGMGPAQYMRLSRFVKSLYMMPTDSSLTDIAYGVYYADQAHFCRDFKEIAGMTPKEYRQRMSPVLGHIFDFQATGSAALTLEEVSV